MLEVTAGVLSCLALTDGEHVFVVAAGQVVRVVNLVGAAVAFTVAIVK